MGTARFGLRGNKIYLFFRNGRSQNFRYSTRIKVNNQKNWDSKHQRLKDVIGEFGVFQKNIELRKLMNFFKDLNPENYSNMELKEFLNNKSQNTGKKKLITPAGIKKPNLIEYFDYVIKNDVSKATKSSYTNCLNHLKRYNPNLNYENINLNFYDDFTKFLKNCRKSVKGKPLPNGYAPNTIAATFKVLKTVMDKAYKRNYHSNRKYGMEEFKVEFLEGKHRYLTLEEIDKVIELDIGSRELIDARKLFIIGCFCSLRISDLTSIDNNTVINEFLEYVPKKNNKPTNRNEIIYAPVNTKTKKILSDGLPSTSFSKSKFNLKIKELCRLANIENPNQITSHTLRRTFCTQAHKAGIDMYSISYIMGHSSPRVTENYLKLSSNEKAAIIKRQNPFLQ